MEPATVAGLVAAEQAVSTTLEVGIPAAYALTRPTLPLSATLTRITSPAFLPRCHHTCCVVNKHAYLYGGENEKGELAGGEVHIVTLPLPIKRGRVGNGDADYKCVPPLGAELKETKVGVDEQGGEAEMGVGQVQGHAFEGEAPAPRSWHTAVSVGRRMYVYGGRDEKRRVLGENIVGRVWVFDTETLRWSALDPADTGQRAVPEARWGHGSAVSEMPSVQPHTTTESEPQRQGLGVKIREGVESVAEKVSGFVTGKPSEASLQPHGTIVVYGGTSASNELLKDAWVFDIAERIWTRLPDPPLNGKPDLATGRLAVSDGRVFVVAHPDPIGGGEVHSLQLAFPTHKQHSSTETDEGSSRLATSDENQDPDSAPVLEVTDTPEQKIQQQTKAQNTQPQPPTWQTHTFPTNPLTPGPLPRQGAALLPLHLGNGRHYLLYALGAHAADPLKPLPPGGLPEYHSTIYAYQPPATTVSAAGVKDATRSKLGADTGEGTWAELVVQANEEAGGDGEGGKAHPGPRGWFASAALEGSDGIGAVIWGGKNGKGGVEGDGWVVSVLGA